MWLNTYLHAITFREKRSTKFKEEYRGLYGRIWRKEVGVRKFVIIISKIKEKITFFVTVGDHYRKPQTKC